MSNREKELEAAVLALPQQKRAKLAERLIASLDEETQIDDLWREEIRNRIEEYQSGNVETYSADEVIGEGNKRLTK